MIPFRDNIPSRRYPTMTVTIIVINVLAFLYEISLGRRLDDFLYLYGVVPAYLSGGPGFGLGTTVVPMFTSMFLHGGWIHLLGNMWYLWIFGDNVEDRLGHFRFVLFYLLCGVGASAVHILFNFDSQLPSIGASGAIAGVLGAYMISYPFARILTLVPLFFFLQVIELPALLVLGFWFLIQLFSGTAAVAQSSQTAAGGVAWWAHIGGFILGILLLRIFLPWRQAFVSRWR